MESKRKKPSDVERLGQILIGLQSIDPESKTVTMSKANAEWLYEKASLWIKRPGSLSKEFKEWK